MPIFKIQQNHVSNLKYSEVYVLISIYSKNTSIPSNVCTLMMNILQTYITSKEKIYKGYQKVLYIFEIKQNTNLNYCQWILYNSLPAWEQFIYSIVKTSFIFWCEKLNQCLTPSYFWNFASQKRAKRNGSWRVLSLGNIRDVTKISSLVLQLFYESSVKY